MTSTSTSSCRSGRPLSIAPLDALSVLDLRGYAALEVAFGPGTHLIWGPNAAGKTSLLEAIALLAWGRSHRTNADGELIRWGRDLARIEGRVGGEVLEVAIARSGADGSSGRKRIRINGVGRRAASLGRILRAVSFAPEDMLLVVGSPSLRRAAIDALAAARFPAYADDLATYGRTLQQRNSLLRSIREEQASREELRFWDDAFIDSGGRVVTARLGLLDDLAEPIAAAHREIAPEEAAGGLTLRYATNSPTLSGETPRDALARRLVDTADKEIWNGSTVIGPHRDDVAFDLAARDLAGFASRGQQRTAILAFKLAELDLLTALDGRPPLLLLDDVFSELDPDRRGHLVRRIAALPQAFVTTTTPDDLDPALRAIAHGWVVHPEPAGAELAQATAANHTSAAEDAAEVATESLP
ncbi:MAG TPA: DNA replication and repair protein RecF [Candidatus Limnocylindrales bacterium]|nr:DNA replication and repair protein RecF [Candidatus Limnocylindrales bacterium]